MKDLCKNCGGPLGIHHYQTLQCPVGGREAPIGRKQEYMSTTYQEDQDDMINELKDEIRKLHLLISNLEDRINKIATPNKA